jgi:uncharacterized protein (DUF433 family)
VITVLSRKALNETPTYAFSEAAYFLQIPVSTLRSWVFGQKYRTQEGTGFFQPLIDIQIREKEPKLLSFINLVEAHVLDSMRRSFRVPMLKVRRGLEYVTREMKIEHPLAHASFQTDGVDLFVHELGRLVTVSNWGQTAFREILEKHLKRIERDDAGLPIRLFPFTRNHKQQEQNPTVVIDPGVSFGRPVLVGTGIPIRVLYDRFRAGDTIEALSTDYNCDSALLQEAIRFALPPAA